MKKLSIVLALAISGAGCTTVRMSSPEALEGVKFQEAGDREGRALVIASDAYYLFQIWPIVSGSVEWDEEESKPCNSTRWFCHEIDAQNFINLMTKIAEHENADLVDICIENKWTAPLQISLYDPISWFQSIIGQHRMNYSAVIVPRDLSTER